MDTRSKIVNLEEARAAIAKLSAENQRVLVVAGTWDVLTPATVARLVELSRSGSRLVAYVTSPAGTLLSAAARSELAAALRMVDYVVVATGDTPAASLRGELVDEVDSHRAATEQLIRHVQERQLAAQ